MRNKLSKKKKGSGFGGELWAGYSDLMAGLLLVFMFVSLLARIATANIEGDIRDALKEPTRELEEWRSAILSLCTDETLKKNEIEVDCNTGTIILPEHAFFGFNKSKLKEDSKERLRQAVVVIINQLQIQSKIWEKLELVEIRGHADPRGDYAANLDVSQQRSFNVLYFLSTDDALRKSLGENNWSRLRKLSVASGASNSRPHEDCKLKDEDCYDKWRRVEIMLGFDDHEFRKELYEMLENITKLIDQRL